MDSESVWLSRRNIKLESLKKWDRGFRGSEERTRGGRRARKGERGWRKERESFLSLLLLPRWRLSLTKAMKIGEPSGYNAKLGRRQIFLARYIAEDEVVGVYHYNWKVLVFWGLPSSPLLQCWCELTPHHPTHSGTIDKDTKWFKTHNGYKTQESQDLVRERGGGGEKDWEPEGGVRRRE